MNRGHLAHVSATQLGVRQIADALDAFCRDARVPEDIAWRLRVAVDEIVANVVAYAAAGPTPPDIDVEFCREADRVEITIADTGVPFDPLRSPAPDTTAPLAKRQPGGLGIMLVKSLMDEVLYTHTTRDVVTLRKRLP